MPKKVIFLFTVAFISVISLSTAEEVSPPLHQQEEFGEKSVETFHKVTIDGQEISYKATAGTLLLRDDEGKKKGKIFYIAYTKDNESQGDRPITFCFNGGPGSSSVWLHLGTFGPKRAVFTEGGESLPPYKLSDNEASILDLTDLVFIDPISTGYSRAAPGEDPKQFHGVDEDIQSIGEFIRLYVTRFSRWDSPKFLAGESYGTTRAAGLAGYLHDDVKMYLKGIILVSSILDFQTVRAHLGNDLPYLLYLPSYTAAAWYHKQLPEDLQRRDLPDLLKEVQEFSLNKYALALLKGDELGNRDRQQVIQKLSHYTGLSTEYIANSNMRVHFSRYVKELLRKQRRTMGVYDTRFMGIDRDACGECYQYDPSADVVMGVFTQTFNDYVRKDLQWVQDDEYKILTDVFPWNYEKATNKFLNVADTLRSTMTRNPHLYVFVANGYYDLATPYFATEYTFNHFGLDPALRDHVKMGYYEAGHMMYIHQPSRLKLKRDIAQFMQDALKPANKGQTGILAESPK